MRKILIVEADPMIAHVYGVKYSVEGFETRVAPDGGTGLEMLASFGPDLVHLDLLVPGINGVEIIKHIRSHPDLKHIPIVVLSNTYQNRLIKAAMEAGASVCVSKATCTPKMMMEIVNKFRDRMPAEPPIPPVLSAEIEAPSSTPGPPAAVPSNTQETRRHAAFHAEITQDFRRRGPLMVAALRERVEPLLRAETEATRVPELSGLCQAAHSFAGHAGIAGFQELAQMASAVVALLKELLEKPAKLNASALRTIVDAIDFLAVLFERTSDSEPEAAAPPIVLVVDDEVMSRRAVVHALARLNVATISVEEPAAALQLLAENRFSLVFLDVEMPGMNGFQLCEELRKLKANQGTPVVFVTSLSGFESRERSVSSGANDLIAKPFLPMELAVKALSLLRKTESPER
jgi:CheY-like chemotaxis protein